MEEKKENIEQIDKKKIDSNLIVDNQKTTERKISTGLIDNEVNPQKNEDIKKLEAQILLNIIENIIEENKNNNAKKIILNEKDNINKIITNFRNVRNDDDFCRTYGSLFCIKIFSLLIVFLFASIFIYYKNHCTKCKSVLYTKVNKVLLNYLGTLIASIIDLIIIILLDIKGKYCSVIIDYLFAFAIFITHLGLNLANLIIVQINYNKTKTWENCGNFKEWMKCWLILGYIGIVFKFIINIVVFRYF